MNYLKVFINLCVLFNKIYTSKALNINCANVQNRTAMFRIRTVLVKKKRQIKCYLNDKLWNSIWFNRYYSLSQSSRCGILHPAGCKLLKRLLWLRITWKLHGEILLKTKHSPLSTLLAWQRALPAVSLLHYTLIISLVLIPIIKMLTEYTR